MHIVGDFIKVHRIKERTSFEIRIERRDLRRRTYIANLGLETRSTCGKISGE